MPMLQHTHPLTTRRSSPYPPAQSDIPVLLKFSDISRRLALAHHHSTADNHRSPDFEIRANQQFSEGTFVAMKQYLLRIVGMMAVALVFACNSLGSATPTVAPELTRLDLIKSDVRTACDTYIRQEARGSGNAIDLIEKIGRAYSDALNLFESMDSQSPHIDDIRLTLSRIATVQRHMETFESEMVSLIERLFEDETATLSHWKTTSVEMCSSW